MEERDWGDKRQKTRDKRRVSTLEECLKCVLRADRMVRIFRINKILERTRWFGYSR